MPYTDFHYTPTGTGVISGKEVLEQTEDAINDLGGQISGDVQTAIDTANNALNVANTASSDAQNAVNTANTAHTAATNAQNTANAAQTTATNAQTAAQNAQNDVNALGNRVTTAENNITQNTTDISGLTTRMGTAEGNITTLQNDVVTAQGTATSAQNTATMARQQAYVLRYSSTAITDNSTIAYSTLDNTDNIKADDKIIDVDGKIFSIVSVDSDNSTVTVGSALIDLALDADVMHLSGNETASGEKVFGDVSTFDGSYIGNEASTNARTVQILESNRDTHGQSGIFLTKFRQNKAQGSMSGNDIAYLSYDCLENSVRTNNGFRINFLNFVDDIPQRFMLWSGITERLLGVPGSPWSDVSTNKINGLNPGSLSFPDLSAGLDISGYLTTGTTSNTYTALADGYISIRTTSTSSSSIHWSDSNGIIGGNASYTIDLDGTTRVTNITFPVNKGWTYTIVFKSITNIVSAKFFPCLGNV